ncbi:hypothetical protein [Acinetobacter soli]|uniref:hypothetical protein n=1 Tax=Acinetobacter soli TaxID=487316 RepID=UPI001BABD42E|nr:hypothetical protein [Acinetobacter soli]
MYLRYTMFKTDGEKVLSSHGIGLSNCFIYHAAEILYKEVQNSASFDRYIERLSKCNTIKYNHERHGDKARIVYFVPEDLTRVSYSTTYSERVENANIDSFDLITLYAEYKTIFSCIYFDISTNTWSVRTYTDVLTSMGMLKPPVAQLAFAI